MKKVEAFNNFFDVYKLGEYVSFFHFRLDDCDQFYRNMFDYFFSEERLLRYIENKKHLHFEPTNKNYALLYKYLKIFIDDYNQHRISEDILKEIKLVLYSEGIAIKKENEKTFSIRLDKIGKIGEYIFCNLLAEYFDFTCIIPKTSMITNYNMSIFGIDTIFYSKKENMILFGESKVSKSVKNGIDLVNESLKNYEKQMENEFELILSNRILKNQIVEVLGEEHEEYISLSLSMRHFIEKASIKTVGIPIFVAHGTEQEVDTILPELKRIKKKKFFNLETNYIIISLPIIDKERMSEIFTMQINEKREYYERKV